MDTHFFRTFILMLGLFSANLSVAETAKPLYEHFIVGNPSDAQSSFPQRIPTTVLMGGGPDVATAFRWLIAKSGGGDFVVIRSRGGDGYNPYIFGMGGVDSVETLVIPTREAANDPFVIDRISKAEVLFIAGGYQSDYVRLWKGTGVAKAIQDLIIRNVPIGGASAGLAILGQFDFAALNGTIVSDAALSDPYNPKITLDLGFITADNLKNVITDSHLDFRNRMGRLVTFLARIAHDGWSSRPRGIGIDVGTALIIEGNVAFRVGRGSVFFLQTNGFPQVCRMGFPLTYHNVQVQRLSNDDPFDMVNWRSFNNETTNYSLSVENGVLISSQPGGQIY